MALSVSAVKGIVLGMIGGSPLMAIPTTRILGSVTTAQLNPAALASLASLAKSVAGDIATLQRIVKNPVGFVTDRVLDKVGELTRNNFQELDTKLSNISSDSEVSASYSKLKKALGGGDGVSGLNAQLTKFKDHTDRLSGVKLSADSGLSVVVEDKPGGRVV